MVIQYRVATVRVAKISLGGTGSFSFSGNNGWGTDSVTTTSTNVAVNGVTKTLATSGTATTLTETVPSGYQVTNIACTGIGTGSATYNLTAGTAALDAIATANANDVTCTYTNAKLPTVRLSKISLGGTGTFTFSGDNGFGSDSITTATAGVAVNGTPKTLSSVNTATVLTETIPSTYFMTGLTCSGLGSGSAVYDMNAGTASLNAAATAPGNVINCTYTNTLSNPALTIVKTANTSGPLTVGRSITYTYSITNSGNRPIANVSIVELFNGGGTPPSPSNEVLATDVSPLGDTTDSGVPNGIWNSLGVGDTITMTATYVVQQSDIDSLQ